MAYHTKSDAERGPVGTWMRRERITRGWSVAVVSQQLLAIGESVTLATFEEVQLQRTDIDRLADAINRLAAVLERKGGT